MTEQGVQNFPAFIICREEPYIDGNKQMSNLSDFLNNTLYLSYHVYDPTGFIELNSMLLKREYVYSITRGMCYILKYTEKVNLFYACFDIISNINHF